MTKKSRSISHSTSGSNPASSVVVVAKVFQSPTLGQSIQNGIGVGIGVSVAQKVVNGIFDMFSIPKSSNPVENQKVLEFKKCMEYNIEDYEKCKSFIEKS